MDTAEPHKCVFTIQIDAAVDTQTFAAPSFRFRFLEGSNKQTPVIGAAGWSLVPTAAAAAAAAAAAPSPLESSSEDGDDSSSSLDAARLPPQDTLRYEQVFADVPVTEALAKSLDDDPVLSFFLADHPGLASGSAAPASQIKDTKGGKSTSALTPEQGDNAETKAPRAYAGVYDLDASSLLAGNLLIEQIWAPETPIRDDSRALANVFSPKMKATRAERKQRCQSLFFLLPPSEPSGLKYLAIRILVDQPLLCSALAKKLNPLTISLTSARHLPGISSTSSSRTVARSPHTPLRQLCRPVYALLQFYPDRLRAPHTSSGHQIHRLIVTPGKPQEENIDWDHHVTFLSARFNRAELLDTLQFAALAVEIHDRDLTQVDKMRRLVDKWESLHATGVDITAPTTGRAAAKDGDSPASSSLSRTTSPRSGASNAQPQQTKSMDIFAVDEIARRDCQQLLLRAGEFFPHGLASFRLNELLNSAKQLVGPKPQQQHESYPFMSFKMAADVVAVKRRAKPLGAGVFDDDEDPFAVFDLTPTEKLVREPGTYLANGTTITIHVTLQHPLKPLPGNEPQGTTEVDQIPSDHELSSPRPAYSRMVLIIPYDDNRTLNQVSRVMADVNLAALPGVPIRSYQMTESEKRACESGELDIITGMQVIDSQFRTIILEGLAGKGMKHVYEQIPRQAANDPNGYRMCANDQILFTQRLYTAFEIDLKRIKLRYPLPTLLTSPDIYMRSKVSENCYKALMRLADMRQAGCLEEVKNFDLFPTAQMLVEVESKYGESITLDDIHGRAHAERRGSGVPRDRNQSALAHGLKRLDSPPPETSGSADSPTNNNREDGGADKLNSTSSSRRHATTLKAPTESTNDAFEKSRKNRKDKDFLSERRKESEAVRSEYVEKKKLLADAQLHLDQPATPIYMYSGQKLRTQDALQDEMRKQLAKDRLATYTYSSEFQSLAVSLVDPDALRQIEESESRKKWTTERGFVYPAPRRPDEYYKHKDAPSQARCEDLRAPFVDNANHPTPVSRAEGDPASASTRPAFSTLPSKDMIFGGTNSDGTVNAEYFRSVHLCGEGLRQEQEEALKRELAEWERRLVVDKKQVKFLAHGNITGQPREKPAQLDKISDILRGAARSKPIRIVKNATLPSGKRVPLEAPPVTVHNQQEYAGSVATQFATTLRQTAATQFLATNPATGTPKDFHFPSNTDLLTPQVKKHVSRKEIAPVASSEKQGLVWRNNQLPL